MASRSATLSQQKALLPRWNICEKTLDPGSRDPLGFQRYATRFADQLLPNLTVLTTRARYYAFLAWTLDEMTSHLEPRLLANDAVPFEEYDEMIMRFERFLAFAEAIRHAEEGKSCSWIGQRRSSSLIRKGRTSIPLDVSLTIQEGSKGALADYRQSLRKLGLLSQESAPLPDKLTEEGEELAQRYRVAIQKSKANRISERCLDLNLNHISLDDFRADGRLMCLSEISEPERRFLRPRLLHNEHELIVSELQHFLKRRQMSEAILLIEYLKSKSRQGVAFGLRQAAVYQVLALACLNIFVGIRSSFEGVNQEQKLSEVITRQLKLEGLLPNVAVSSLTKRLDWEAEIRILNTQGQGESATWIEPSIRLLMHLAREIHSEPQLVFNEAIESVSLAAIIDLMFQQDWSVQDLLARIAEQLINAHQRVFSSKSKRPWMYVEGAHIFLAEEAQEPVPQFPPNRLRLQSLISVYRDLEGRHG